MECLTCSAHLLLRSAQEGRQEMSPRLTDLPTVGEVGAERSQYCPGRETNAWGRGCLHCSQKTGSGLPLSQSAWIEHPGLLPPWLLSWAFLKLHKKALGPDTVPGHRVMFSRPEDWGHGFLGSCKISLKLSRQTSLHLFFVQGTESSPSSGNLCYWRMKNQRLKQMLLSWLVSEHSGAHRQPWACPAFPKAR